MKRNKRAAVEVWARLVWGPSSPKVPRRIRTRALSCLCSAIIELQKKPDSSLDAMDVEIAYLGAFCSNESASLGFVSPCVLLVGMNVQELMKNESVPEVDKARFRELEFLWETAEKWEIERAEEQERMKRDKRFVRAPSKYACAAAGCGTEGTRKAGLLKCSGKCSGESKPLYCSKECQTDVSAVLFCCALNSIRWLMLWCDGMNRTGNGTNQYANPQPMAHSPRLPPPLPPHSKQHLTPSSPHPPCTRQANN